MRQIAKQVLGTLLAGLPRPPSAPQGALCITWRIGWLKGLRYRAVFAIQNALGIRKVRGGKGLSVEGRLRVRGPGAVVFDDFVIIGSSADLFTHSSTATITIGRGTFLNGTRFGCADSIRVGSRCILADCRIMDTDFHSIYEERHSPEAPIGTEPVEIGDNVWVAAGVFVLRGSILGSNSVIGCGSVVAKPIAPNSIATGNPVRVVGSVPRLADRVAAEVVATEVKAGSTAAAA